MMIFKQIRQLFHSRFLDLWHRARNLRQHNMELIIKNKELQQALEREVETNLYLSGQLAEHEDRMEKLSIQREEELAA